MNQSVKHITERKKRPSLDISTMIYGKVPPQAKEIEEAVLGAVMLEKDAFDRVSEILKPESFYVDAHQRIFKAFIRIASANKIVELLSVVEELKRSEELEIVGGPFGVTRLTNAVVSTAGLDQHARIVHEMFIKREIIRIGSEMIADGYEETTDPFDLLDDTEAKVFAIANNHLKKNFESIISVAAKVVNRIDTLRKSDEMISGVPSGFPTLDRVTYGWQSTDLIILAARPAVGKTAFALNLARNAAKDHFKPTPVGFFSLEMSAQQLVQRILSAESEIWLEKISRGRMDDTEYVTLSKGIKKMESMPIFIDDSAALNIFEFRAKARRMVNKHKVGFIIIDYLQLMSGSKEKNGNREQEISTISRNLKALAKELNVPIIALSQLSRAVESRKEGQKIPQLSDLRESGAIEQDADMVMFLYRPDYYEQGSNEMGESTKGLTEVKIAKHRNGSLETIKLRALLHIQKFTEWDGPNTPSGGNFIPVKGSSPANFDDGFTDDQPF